MLAALIPIAATLAQDLAEQPNGVLCLPAGEVAPELIGCLLVKRHAAGELVRGVNVETQTYCQSEPVLRNSTNFQGPLSAIAGPASPHAEVRVWFLLGVGWHLVLLLGLTSFY